METPLLSVRLMTYNHAPFIKEAIESVLKQETNFSFEIVIGDDFSTDGTREICKKYADEYPDRIRFLDRKKGDDYFKERQKRGRLFNFVNIIKNCKGQYIALLDGDDYWNDTLKLQKQVDFLEANEEYVLCHHDAKIVTEKGEIKSISKLQNENKRDFNDQELQKGALILTLTLCFRNLIKEFPSEFTQSHNGDSFLISLLGNYGKAKYLGNQIEPDYYREHSNSFWSSKNSLEKLSKSYTTYSLLYQYYKKTGNSQVAAFQLKNTSDYLTWMLIEAKNENNTLHLRKTVKASIKLYLQSKSPEILKNGLKASWYYLKSLFKQQYS